MVYRALSEIRRGSVEVEGTPFAGNMSFRVSSAVAIRIVQGYQGGFSLSLPNEADPLLLGRGGRGI